MENSRANESHKNLLNQSNEVHQSINQSNESIESRLTHVSWSRNAAIKNSRQPFHRLTELFRATISITI